LWRTGRWWNRTCKNLRGWTEEVRNQGFVPSTRLVSVEEVPAEIHISRALKVPLGTAILRITRVRSASAHPIAVEKAHLEATRFADIQPMLVEQPSLYQILRDRYGILLVSAVQYLESGEADRQTADLLESPCITPSWSPSALPLTRAASRWNLWWGCTVLGLSASVRKCPANGPPCAK
jgi:DNA-binding GntR family transcriptional regulator